MSVHEEITDALVPIFGEDIRGIMEKYYDDKEVGAMAKAAEHMLVGYLGKEKGHALIQKIISKHK